MDYIGQQVHIRPNYIVSLPVYDGEGGNRSAAQLSNETNLKANEHGGVLSGKSINKMKAAINWLLVSAQPKTVYSKKWDKTFTFKVNFITLTLPDTTEQIDNKCLQTKLLNPFLTYLRAYAGLKNYLWKLEFQSNGKLHVHFISDAFIHHSVLRDAWNRILGKSGFLNDFESKFGHRNPNSTDVHSVKKVKNLAAYLVKYMAKQDKLLSLVKGRIWGCNKALSEALKTSVFIDRDACVTELKPLMSKGIEYKAIGANDKYTGLFRQFGEVFFLKYKNWQHDIKGVIKDKFLDVVSFIQGVTADQSVIHIV